MRLETKDDYDFVKGAWNRNGYGLEHLQFWTTTKHTWGWDV